LPKLVGHQASGDSNDDDNADEGEQEFTNHCSSR